MLVLRSSRTWLPMTLLLGLLVLVVTGCSDDDDNPGTPSTGEVPAELVGRWAAATAFVNGTEIDPGIVLEWTDIVVGNQLTVAADGTYVEQEFTEDRTEVYRYTGVISVDGNQILVLEDSAGKAAADTAFAGTWALGDNVLVLTATEDGDTVVLHFHRLITVDIAFQVTEVSDAENLLGGTIIAGMHGTGSYTYDAGVEDGNALTTVGDYTSTIAPCGIFLTLGALQFQTDLGNVNFLLEVCNDHTGSDNYLLRSYNNLDMSNDVAVDHIAWQLDDTSQAALDGIGLPLIPPELEDWEQIFALTVEGSLIEDPFRDFLIRCNVTSATLAD